MAAPAQDQPPLELVPAMRGPLQDCSTNADPFTGYSWSTYDADGPGNRGNKKTGRSSTAVADKFRARKNGGQGVGPSHVEASTRAACYWTIEQGVLLNLLKDKELDHASEPMAPMPSNVSP